jgi:alpha-N-arabinofuranosidase
MMFSDVAKSRLSLGLCVAAVLCASSAAQSVHPITLTDPDAPAVSSASSKTAHVAKTAKPITLAEPVAAIPPTKAATVHVAKTPRPIVLEGQNAETPRVTPPLKRARAIQLGGGAVGTATLTIDAQDAGKPVSPMLYGLMTEEINHSYDGGLYAQLLSNHTFRNNWAGVEGWGLIRNGDAKAEAKIDKEAGPSKALPTSLKLKIEEASEGNEAGLSNVGYWGIPVRSHTRYEGGFYAKAEGLDVLTAKLVSDATGAVLASTQVTLYGGDWQQYKYSLETGSVGATSDKNHLELTMAKPGTFWIQLATLFPPTFNNRGNGLRVDLMEKMAAMHPHFVRLPGGNYLEGDEMKDWYNFKETIGPLVDRPGHQAPWTYWSTDGMGLLEFLEWTEDLKVEPVLAVYAGYALKHDYAKPGKDLEPYVQAALDEVEYVTGDVSTKWGAERAKDGHPAPFPLHYIEIGNEDEFDKSGSYDARFAQFAEALRKKYPQYKLIATTPVKEAAGTEPDVIDDHYYKSPADMFDLVHHYDAAPRTGPKVFVGEWATRSGSPTPNMGDALGDAAWMTSMERNSDLIVMASYAPLLVNVNPGGMQWSTDLIGYDAVKSYGSPSYWAQVMFGGKIGDSTPHSEITGAQERFFYSVTKGNGKLYVKLVNASNLPQPLSVELKGLSAGAHVAKVTSLHAESFQATNSITEPEVIHPMESVRSFAGIMLKQTLAPYTIEVVEVMVK